MWHVSKGLQPVLFTVALLASAALQGAEEQQAPPQHADIRVLIDISGSMRQNDPNNLRRPALRMLSGLMQPGTRAGVWTFARWVNNLMPVADVDAAWKKRVQSLSNQIASPGQFTNIEEVLDRASRDWEGPPSSHARHLVLLTDGMVDVSKQDAENSASRQRIVDDLLPRLKQAEVKVHSIALSQRADHELLKRLAGETGGWYQQVDSADELQRVFLKMFETVGKPDAVPLQDNRFVVDGSVNEATVLVFSKPDAAPVVLHSPDGGAYSDSDLTAGVAWFHDQGYHLITIASPQKGEWRLDADVDPDNRVMIVTDLKLQTSEIPSHLAVGELMHVEAYLTNRAKLVDRQAFLRLLEVRAESVTSNGSQPRAMSDGGQQGDAIAGDGRYSMQFGETEPYDSVELLISVDSPTFMREKRFRLAVHELAEGKVEQVEGGLQLNLQTSVAVLQGTTEVSAWQQDATGQRIPLDLQTAAEGGWSALLGDPQAPVYVHVSGTSRLGNLLDRTIGPIVPPGVPAPAQVAEAPPPPPEPVEPPPVAEPPPVEPTAVQPPVEEAAPAPIEEPGDEEGAGWLMPAIVFGGFNLVLLIAGGVWFLVRRRRGGGDDEFDLDVALDESPAEATKPEQPPQEDAA
ncbi:MAG: VWA domain-containing protein [Chromatiaceae bacterium]|nr:VWA domain-containing protein [Chromatiaceae bacterium]